MHTRATESDGIIDVKILMKRDMETGQRKNVSDRVVPAWHIANIMAQHGGKAVLGAQLGPTVSKDSSLSLKFKDGVKDDKVTVTWIDDHGDKRADGTPIQ